jgi:4-amino-4-deoxy-L-arabinose transferase-like glycosyltransferase
MQSEQTIRKQVSAVSALRSPTLAVVAALAVRIAFLSISRSELWGHWKFHALGLEEGLVAWSLATGKGFSGPFPGYETATAWLAPVYPFLWAVCIKLSHLNPDLQIRLAQNINCVFSAATSWPIYSIGKRLFGGEAGRISAWLWALLPAAILLPVLWTWDQSLAALTLAVIVDATLRLSESTKPLPRALPGLGCTCSPAKIGARLESWTGYGLLWAFAALVNPTLCGLLPFLLGWLIVQRRRLGEVSLAPYARAMVMFVLALLPWTVRSYYAVGGWFFVKSNLGVELALGNHDPSMAAEPMNSLPERFRLIFEGEADYSREKQRQAMAYIKAHPGTFLKNTLDRFRRTWMPANDAEMIGAAEGPHLGQSYVWFCAGFSLVSLAGLALAYCGQKDQTMDRLPLAICVLVFPIPYYISLTDIRYRHPIDPFLTIFTAYALCKLWNLFSTPPATERAQQAQSF